MDIQKIEEETKLIKSLESSMPEYNPNIGRYHPDNIEFEKHWQKIEDAYWRRRKLWNEEIK